MATDSGSSVFDSLVEDHTALMQTLSKKLTLISSKGEGASVRTVLGYCLSFFLGQDIRVSPCLFRIGLSVPLPVLFAFKQLRLHRPAIMYITVTHECIPMSKHFFHPRSQKTA
jgi:hypothetical protein